MTTHGLVSATATAPRAAQAVAAPTSAVTVELEPRSRDAIREWAGGRRLEVDWFAVACCGAMAGDLRLRWRRQAEPLDPELVGVDGLAPLEVFVRSELVEVLPMAGAVLAMRGFGPFRRRPTVLLHNGRAWMEFIARSSPRR